MVVLSQTAPHSDYDLGFTIAICSAFQLQATNKVSD